MDELDDTLALLDDLEQFVNSGRVVVDVDEDLPPRFRPVLRGRSIDNDAPVPTGESGVNPAVRSTNGRDAAINPRDLRGASRLER